MTVTNHQTATAPAPSKAWLARRMATVAVQTAVEKVRPKPATLATDVPGSAKELTPQWLTALVCKDVPGAQVMSFLPGGASSGSSTRVALELTYNPAGRAAGLPERVFAKIAATFPQRLLLGGADVLRTEAIFFNVLRPQLDMEAPLGYAGVYDSRRWKSAVLMEDVAVSKGATFPEPIHALSRDQVEDAVLNLARMHGAMWEHPDLSQLGKTPMDHHRLTDSLLDMRKRCAVGMERAKDVVHPDVYGEAGRLWEGNKRALQLATDSLPRTLLHGDGHVGQTYITADKRMGWADWQVIMAGGWGYDFAYFVSSACEPEDRREWDRGLLEAYLEELGAHGGKPPVFAEAWKIYCQQLFYPWAAWSFTIGRAAYQPKMQPDEYSQVILRRMSHAIAENDAFKALGL